MQNTEEQILARIKKAMGGMPFFADSFVNFGNAKSVNKALERLVKSGEIDRVRLTPAWIREIMKPAL